jgi:flavin reductase (DIM6/NTAB) family NADH-FMN oxidoreductase RutF
VKPDARRILKRLLLGPASLPQKVDFGLQDPQSEVDVWLHGLGNPLDVTHRHLMACGAPLTIGIGLDADRAGAESLRARLALRFREHAGDQRFLGEIGLRFVSTLSAGPQHLCLFHVAHYKNYCLSPLRLWAHHLQYARAHRKAGDRDSDVPITTRETRAMIVFFLCPRPTALVTVGEAETGNMFPMNLMGPVGNGYFAFALNSNRAAAPLVERASRVVLSSVPPEQASVISRLGANHRKSSIDWSQLPFAIVRPKTIDAPVAAFARRVREMQVETVHQVGSHTLFVARTIAEECVSQGPQLFSAHGIYQAWRQKDAVGWDGIPT